MWIFRFTCLVFKTTYIDRRKPLRDGAFLFVRMVFPPPLDKRNIRDKAQGLCITSERYNRVNLFCLPGWVLLANRTVMWSYIGRWVDLYSFASWPILVTPATYIGWLADQYRLVVPPSVAVWERARSLPRSGLMLVDVRRGGDGSAGGYGYCCGQEGRHLRIWRSCITFATATKKVAILFLSSVG